MVFCENEKTGEIEVRADGKCREGYIERIQRKVERDGIVFVRSKVTSREE